MVGPHHLPSTGHDGTQHAQHCVTNCGLELLLLLVSVSNSLLLLREEAEHDTVQRALHAAQVTRPVNWHAEALVCSHPRLPACRLASMKLW